MSEQAQIHRFNDDPSEKCEWINDPLHPVYEAKSAAEFLEILSEKIHKNRKNQWLIADILTIGLDKFTSGSLIHSIKNVTGLDHPWHIIRTARAFPPERRRPGLSFTFHRLCVALPSEVVDNLLSRAEAQGWSRDELREHIRDHALEGKIASFEAENERLRRQLTNSRDFSLAGRRRVEDAARSLVSAVKGFASVVDEVTGDPALPELHGNAQRGLARGIEQSVQKASLAIAEVFNERIDESLNRLGASGALKK